MSLHEKIDVLLAKESEAPQFLNVARVLNEGHAREDDVRRDLRDLALSKDYAREQCKAMVEVWAELLRERLRGLSARHRAIRRFRRRLHRISSVIEEETAVATFDDELRTQSFLERAHRGGLSLLPVHAGSGRMGGERDAPKNLWGPARSARYVCRARRIRAFFTERLLASVRDRGQIACDCREIACRIRDVGEQLDLPVAGLLAEVPAECLDSKEPASVHVRASLERGNASILSALSVAVKDRTAELQQIVEFREALQQAVGCAAK